MMVFIYFNLIEKDAATSVKVVVRCRPPSSTEKSAGIENILSTDNDINEILLQFKATTRSYKYDKVFGQLSSQEDVYKDSALQIVNDVLDGYNGTVVVYGQTGTGKTYTLEGSVENAKNKGIIPRAINTIFESLKKRGAEFNVKVSSVQIYGEVLFILFIQKLVDLLKQDNTVTLQDDIDAGVVCNGLTETDVANEQAALKAFEDVIKAKSGNKSDPAKCNNIFTLSITSKEKTSDGETVSRVGRLNFVECAGSELTTRHRHERVMEGKNIARSVITLGRVITALVDRNPRIPYRDSKLTRLIQEAFGGNCKTCFIATITPSQLSLDQTALTLEYAFRATSIINHPTIYQQFTQTALIFDFAQKINDLHKLISAQIGKEGTETDRSEYDNTKKEIDNKTKKILSTESQLEAIKRSETLAQSKLDYYNDDLKSVSSHLKNHIENDKQFEKISNTLKCSLYGSIEDQVDYRNKIQKGLAAEEKNSKAKDQYCKEFKSKLDYLNSSLHDYREYNSKQVEQIKSSIYNFIESHSQVYFIILVFNIC